ncbi:hypothetical protein KSF_078990 [Reticulibacter mediterranei]|uniref:Uncharacterized protein n=1 Tax=Reticulibacter mediterranei TaxID=2778369 RepID=A0A8J3IZ24_9CHLR|nr:hypothetical protein [Reticulibacter mediterranei]GHO97851.1 hypothetical protein KSF_078990 [Reticulibacter mediterranei]
MIEIPKKQADTASLGESRWTLRVGYAACAWGIWFVILHAYVFVGGGGSFNVQSQFARNPWIYVLSTSLSILLFTAAALFPLALIWPFRWLSQPRMQIITLALAYIGMIGFAVYELVFAQELGASLFSFGVCLIGVLVAFVRPHNLSVAHWMVLVATWTIGIGMILYGSSYVWFAFLQSSFEKGLGYFLLGGVNFTVEGILFVAIAYLTSQRGRIRL